METAEFEDLYRGSAGAIFAFVAGMLRDRSAAEEVTAIAFERAFRARATFDPRRGKPRAWMFGIARNAALDELRRRGRLAELPPEPEDRASPGPPELAETSARREIVLRAIDTLELRERELVALRFDGGLSHAEIADILDVTPTNASTMVHRVVTKLRRTCDAMA
ncbi:MAG TPA: sigma-70 family RNA polymerase sigma factor [Solirubrobacteraceae bacterium]|nr:sigma-70 family RNA polymerase sigma factor [Solirubrobacteraceae bacterium]